MENVVLFPLNLLGERTSSCWNHSSQRSILMGCLFLGLCIQQCGCGSRGKRFLPFDKTMTVAPFVRRRLIGHVVVASIFQNRRIS
jgi:hypothetical protein